LGGIGVWQSLDDGPPTPTVAEQVLDAPDASRLSQTFPGGATATIVRSPALGRAVIVTSKMPSAPQGKVYQLWLQDRSGHMSSAGVMPAGSDLVVVLEGDARTATAAGISVEPAGGSAQPTSDPIALFAFT
jgi:anti-sigma-K factor RskA